MSHTGADGALLHHRPRVPRHLRPQQHRQGGQQKMTQAILLLLNILMQNADKFVY